MISLSSNPILEYNDNQVLKVRKLFGYEDQNRLQQDIDILRNWIKKQQHFVVKEYEDFYLERHLICSKGSIERAKKHIDKLCTLRGLMPAYLQGFDIENEFNNILKVCYICVLPKPTPDNYRLLYIDVYNPDASLYEQIYMARYIMLIVEYLHRHDYNAGIEMICDASKITLGVVSKVNPVVVANAFMLMSEAVGLRMKGLHFLLGSKFADVLLSIVKQGLSKKLTSRLHTHDSYESVYKHVPKELFPKEIGGDLPITLKELNERNFKELSSPEFVETIRNIETAVTDESKRIVSKFNEEYSGMPGSFKVMTVD